MYYSLFNIDIYRIVSTHRRWLRTSGATRPATAEHRNEFQSAGDSMNSDDALPVFEETAPASVKPQLQSPLAESDDE